MRVLINDSNEQSAVNKQREGLANEGNKKVLWLILQGNKRFAKGNTSTYWTVTIATR